MDWERFTPQALDSLAEEMAPRVLSTIDPLEKELCVDVADGDRERTLALLFVFSQILLERSIMSLTTIGAPGEVIAALVDRAHKQAADAAGR